MPVHDWTRVDAGIFHDFHGAWITELRNVLNGGLLPSGYYALSEQHAGKHVTDVLTLHAGPSLESLPEPATGGVAVAEAPPKVRRKLTLSAAARSRRKTLAVRHVSGHRVVALLEIVSPGNKDRQRHVDEFLDKMEEALRLGVHLLVVDLFPPGACDPQGMHGALWERLGDEPESPPDDEPLTLAAYAADVPVKAWVEYLSVGAVLPEMPLFLTPGRYVSVPLDASYQATWRGTPEYWRGVLQERPTG